MGMGMEGSWERDGSLAALRARWENPSPDDVRMHAMEDLRAALARGDWFEGRWLAAMELVRAVAHSIRPVPGGLQERAMAMLEACDYAGDD